jgi:hypothetical protein
MPKFSIRRRKKAVPPAPAETEEPEPMSDEEPSEEKVDECEEVATEDVEETFKKMTIAKTRQYEPHRPVQGQNYAPRSMREARMDRYPPNHVPQRRLARSAIPRAAQTLNQRRSLYVPRPSNQVRRDRKLRFGSHYGPGGHGLSTQERARRLYHSCFG